MIDVNGKKGIVIFDGVVIEIFGFGKSGSEKNTYPSSPKNQKKRFGSKN